MMYLSDLVSLSDRVACSVWSVITVGAKGSHASRWKHMASCLNGRQM